MVLARSQLSFNNLNYYLIECITDHPERRKQFHYYSVGTYVNNSVVLFFFIQPLHQPMSNTQTCFDSKFVIEYVSRVKFINIAQSAYDITVSYALTETRRQAVFKLPEIPSLKCGFNIQASKIKSYHSKITLVESQLTWKSREKEGILEYMGVTVTEQAGASNHVKKLLSASFNQYDAGKCNQLCITLHCENNLQHEEEAFIHEKLNSSMKDLKIIERTFFDKMLSGSSRKFNLESFLIYRNKEHFFEIPFSSSYCFFGAHQSFRSGAFVTRHVNLGSDSRRIAVLKNGIHGDGTEIGYIPLLKNDKPTIVNPSDSGFESAISMWLTKHISIADITTRISTRNCSIVCDAVTGATVPAVEWVAAIQMQTKHLCIVTLMYNQKRFPNRIYFLLTRCSEGTLKNARVVHENFRFLSAADVKYSCAQIVTHQAQQLNLYKVLQSKKCTDLMILCEAKNKV